MPWGDNWADRERIWCQNPLSCNGNEGHLRVWAGVKGEMKKDYSKKCPYCGKSPIGIYKDKEKCLTCNKKIKWD